MVSGFDDHMTCHRPGLDVFVDRRWRAELIMARGDDQCRVILARDSRSLVTQGGQSESQRRGDEDPTGDLGDLSRSDHHRSERIAHEPHLPRGHLGAQ